MSKIIFVIFKENDENLLNLILRKDFKGINQAINWSKYIQIPKKDESEFEDEGEVFHKVFFEYFNSKDVERIADQLCVDVANHTIILVYNPDYESCLEEFDEFLKKIDKSIPDIRKSPIKYNIGILAFEPSDLSFISNQNEKFFFENIAPFPFYRIVENFNTIPFFQALPFFAKSPPPPRRTPRFAALCL